MSLQELQEHLRERVRAAALESFNVQLEQVATEVPPRTEMGDLAFPVAFDLARRIKQSTGEKQPPRAIAERLKPLLEREQGVARVEVAGAGYLNLFYDRGRFLSDFSSEIEAASSSPALSDSKVKPTSGTASAG